VSRQDAAAKAIRDLMEVQEGLAGLSHFLDEMVDALGTAGAGGIVETAQLKRLADAAQLVFNIHRVSPAVAQAMGVLLLNVTER
jgi:hypothetical protein